MAMKIVKDPVHSTIEIPDYCFEIIDTPEFQRLRHLKQLGYVEAVYPGANHTRFLHSLGTCFLAGKLVRSLLEKQQSLTEFTPERDIKRVQIAGLCHDLGHGPFSHKFEDVIERVTKKRFKHETASVQILKYILDKQTSKNRLDLTDEDINTITHMIQGKVPENQSEKKFLYQIVSNNDTGIDVDKWDYFARDSYFAGVKNDFDHDHLLQFLRVVKVGEFKEIGFRDKKMESINALFETRWKLHSRVYQHRISGLVQEMVNDVLVMYFKYTEKRRGSNNSELVLSKIVDGIQSTERNKWREACKKYCQLDDRILYKISTSTEKELQEARDLLKRIENRDFYKLAALLQSEDTSADCDATSCDSDDSDDDDEQKSKNPQIEAESNPIIFKSVMKKDEVVAILKGREFNKYKSGGFVVVAHHFSHGKGKQHPLLNVRVYRKHGKTAEDVPKGRRVRSHEIPKTLPRNLQLTIYRIYTHRPLQKKQLLNFRTDLEKRVSERNNISEEKTPKKKQRSKTPTKQNNRAGKKRKSDDADEEQATSSKQQRTNAMGHAKRKL